MPPKTKMRNTYVLHPFQDQRTPEFDEAKKNWTQARTDKQNSLRTVENGGKPIKNGELVGPFKFIAGRQLTEDSLADLTTARDTLYILGHCDTGSDNLKSVDSSHKISAKDLASLLKSSGLPKEFSGKVKVYACFSGIGTSQSESFALRFKRSMVAFEYLTCTIEGYTLGLGNFHHGIGHKFALDVDQDEQEIADACYNEKCITSDEYEKWYVENMIRAKDCRITIQIP